MAKDKQVTGPSSEQAAPAPSRDALLKLLGDVMRAQETKPDELKAKQQPARLATTGCRQEDVARFAARRAAHYLSRK